MLLDIPNLTENNIDYGEESFYYTVDLRATSTLSFHFHFHVLDTPALEQVIREMPKYWDWDGNDHDLEYLLRGL